MKDKRARKIGRGMILLLLLLLLLLLFVLCGLAVSFVVIISRTVFSSGPWAFATSRSSRKCEEDAYERHNTQIIINEI